MVIESPEVQLLLGSCQYCKKQKIVIPALRLINNADFRKSMTFTED